MFVCLSTKAVSLAAAQCVLCGGWYGSGSGQGGSVAALSLLQLLLLVLHVADRVTSHLAVKVVTNRSVLVVRRAAGVRRRMEVAVVPETTNEIKLVISASSLCTITTPW